MSNNIEQTLLNLGYIPVPTAMEIFGDRPPFVKQIAKNYFVKLYRDGSFLELVEDRVQPAEPRWAMQVTYRGTDPSVPRASVEVKAIAEGAMSRLIPEYEKNAQLLLGVLKGF